MVTIMADQVSQSAAYHTAQRSNSLPSMTSSDHTNPFVTDSLPVPLSAQMNSSYHIIDDGSDISHRVHTLPYDHSQSKGLYQSIGEEYHPYNNMFAKNYTDLVIQPYLLQNHSQISQQSSETYGNNPHNIMASMPIIQEEELAWTHGYMPNCLTNQDPCVMQQYNNRASYQIPPYTTNFYPTVQSSQAQLLSPTMMLSTQPNTQKCNSVNGSSMNTKLKDTGHSITGTLSVDHNNANTNGDTFIDSKGLSFHSALASKENINPQRQCSNKTGKSPSSTEIAKMFETFHSNGEFKASFYNPFEVKHRKRTSKYQFKILEKSFQENCKPSTQVRRELAMKLGMTMRGVQVWFQNRRAKLKGLPKGSIPDDKCGDSKVSYSNHSDIHERSESESEVDNEHCKEYKDITGAQKADDTENKCHGQEHVNLDENKESDSIGQNQKECVRHGKERTVTHVQKASGPSAGVLVFNASGEQIYQDVKLDSVNYNQSEKMISKIAHQSDSRSSAVNAHAPLLPATMDGTSSSLHPLFPTFPATMSDGYINNVKKRASSYSSGTFSSIAPALYRKEQVYLNDPPVHPQFSSVHSARSSSSFIAPGYDVTSGALPFLSHMNMQNAAGQETMSEQSFPNSVLSPFHSHNAEPSAMFGQNFSYPYLEQYHYPLPLDGLNPRTTSPASRNRAASMPASMADTITASQAFQFVPPYYASVDPSTGLFYDPYMPPYPNPFNMTSILPYETPNNQFSHDVVRDGRLSESSFSCNDQQHDMRMPEFDAASNGLIGTQRISGSSQYYESLNNEPSGRYHGIDHSRHGTSLHMDHEYMNHANGINSAENSPRDSHDDKNTSQSLSTSWYHTAQRRNSVNAMNSSIPNTEHSNREPLQVVSSLRSIVNATDTPDLGTFTDAKLADGPLYRHQIDRGHNIDTTTNQYEGNGHVHGDILNTTVEHDQKDDDVSYPVW